MRKVNFSNRALFVGIQASLNVEIVSFSSTAPEIARNQIGNLINLSVRKLKVLIKNHNLRQCLETQLISKAIRRLILKMCSNKNLRTVDSICSKTGNPMDLSKLGSILKRALFCLMKRQASGKICVSAHSGITLDRSFQRELTIIHSRCNRKVERCTDQVATGTMVGCMRDNSEITSSMDTADRSGPMDTFKRENLRMG